MSKLIDSIELPSGLRKLSTADLKTVCLELRDELIDSVSDSGGHFASSLGATELTVALHAMFDTPRDRLVWDVGHQGYIHKMLTGRRERLNSIRKKDGLSGFLKREESEYDTFGAGHAGTSISAAVGMSIALQKSNPERYVVPIIGDGSLTAGMAFEALNHAGSLGLKNFIVVLNDNEMSISPNVGALSWFFSWAVTSKTSTAARNSFKDLHQRGYVPEFIYKAIDRAEEAAQGYFSPAAYLFEAFGFRYIGPVDGHDIEAVTKALEHAKDQSTPVLVHTRTKKGKGYEPAEADPLAWHGVKPFDRNAGKFRSGKSAPSAPAYTDVFADALIELAAQDERIVGITAAMSTGTGLDKLEQRLPEQFLDVGICEQHAVTCAAGLAVEGKRPVCAIYSTFLQRAYDQVVHDVCIQNLPVLFAMDRAGVVGNDGETHQGVFDISYLRSIPNITLMAPKDESELRDMLYTGLQLDGPAALRYPRGNGVGVALDSKFQALPVGKGEVVTQGSDVLFICCGPTTYMALRAAEALSSESGLSSTVVNARFIKPLDEKLFAKLARKHQLVCTIEDHAVLGGFGTAVIEVLSKAQALTSAPICFGVGDSFVPHGSQEEQYAMNGYDEASIVSQILKRLQGETSRPLKAVG